MAPPPTGTWFNKASTKTVHDSDFPEFFDLNIKKCNEMIVCVKASEDAQIALYNGKFESSTTKPIIITFGAAKNTKSTITVHGDAKEKAHADKAGLLQPNLYKAYRVEWNRNLIRVMNDGDDSEDAFLWYKSTTAVEIDAFGVKTGGCNGSWVVQGGTNIETTAGADFQHFECKTGKLELDIKAANDVHLAVSSTAKNEAPLFAFLFGSPTTKHGTMYFNGAEVAKGDYPRDLEDDDFVGFWVKWDSEKVTSGKSKSDTPVLTYKVPNGTPQLHFFAVNSAKGSPSFVKLSGELYPKSAFDNFLEQNGNASPKKKKDWER